MFPVDVREEAVGGNLRDNRAPQLFRHLQVDRQAPQVAKTSNIKEDVREVQAHHAVMSLSWQPPS